MSTGNAQAVVEAWRTSTERSREWSGPALSMTSSAINRAIAHTWAGITRDIDAQASALSALGFSDGLTVMRELRGLASQAAHRQQQAAQWARELAEAEAEFDAAAPREEGKQ